jgi:hypothetical protein
VKQLVLDVPTFGFVVMTRALLGLGVGLLVSDRLSPATRRAVGLTLVTVGAATTIPAVLAARRSRQNRPSIAA